MCGNVTSCRATYAKNSNVSSGILMVFIPTPPQCASKIELQTFSRILPKFAHAIPIRSSIRLAARAMQNWNVKSPKELVQFLINRHLKKRNEWTLQNLAFFYCVHGSRRCSRKFKIMQKRFWDKPAFWYLVYSEPNHADLPQKLTVAKPSAFSGERNQYTTKEQYDNKGLKHRQLWRARKNWVRG